MMAKNRYIDGYYLGASGAMVPTDMAMMTAKAQASAYAFTLVFGKGRG